MIVYLHDYLHDYLHGYLHDVYFISNKMKKINKKL